MHIDQEKIIGMLEAAGYAVMQYYKQSLEIFIKSDGSPVSQADIASNVILIKGLQALTPNIPILSEELPVPPVEILAQWRCYWAIDPLDGTRDFLARTDEFCICVALIQQGSVILSALHDPVQRVSYFSEKGKGVWRVPVGGRPSALCKPPVSERTRLIVSRAGVSVRLQDFAKQHHMEVHCCGSALKFIRLIEGKADLFIRGGTSPIWDVAVGIPFVEAFGGQCCDFQGVALSFAIEKTVWSPGFIAFLEPQHSSVWKRYSLRS